MSQKAATAINKKLGAISFKQVALAAAALAGTIAYAMKKSIDAASDLQEVQGKFDVVFKGQEVIAASWADTLVKSYAMSEREAKKYLSSIQDLLVPMGMNAVAAGKMSHEVVKLSADLGSFNNLPTAQVMGDIQSALVGNFETMKKYGVVLNAIVVQEKALAMGLAETKEALTAGQKAQAAYALMVQGSTAAIGDMDRTSGSYANQTKKLRANIEDIVTAIGKELLPVFTDWTAQINTLIELNPEAIEGIAEFAGDVFDLATNIGTAAIEMAELIPSFKLLIEAYKIYKDLQGGEETQGPPGGQWGEAIDAAAADDAAGGGPTKLTPEDLEAEKERLEELEEMWADFREIDIEKAQEYDDLMIAAHEETNALLLQMDRDKAAEEIALEKQKAALKIALTKSQTANAIKNAKFLYNYLFQESKTAFKIYKAYKIAETMIDTYKSAMGAFSAMSSIPIIGPALGVVAAALAIGVGMARVAQIKAMQPGGGGGGGGGGSVGVAVPAAPTTGIPTFDTLDKDEKERGTLTINIQGDFIGDESYIDNLVERINEAEDRDVFINQTNFATELS